jgi:hypothetical protein
MALADIPEEQRRQGGRVSANKQHWYRIYVTCTSTERFDVPAISEKEALDKYHSGDATLEGDEVDSREVVDVEKGRAVE